MIHIVEIILIYLIFLALNSFQLSGNCLFQNLAVKRVSIIELFSILYVVYSQYEGILDFDQVKWTDVIDPVTEGTEYDVAKY